LSATDINYRKAYLDSFLLDIENIEDTIEKSIGINEIPFRDGALTDDLGLKARRVKFKCYFYEEHYEEHRNLLEHLKERSLFELIHPKYGLMKGRVETITVKHDERLKTAEIDIAFVEHLRTAFEVAHTRPNVESEIRDAFETSVGQVKEEFKQSAIVEIGVEATTICSQALVAGQSAFSQFTGISRMAQMYVKKVDVFVAHLENDLAAIENPANSFIAAIDFGLNLPGRVIGTIARTAERYGLLYDSIRSMPEKFLTNLRDSLIDLGNSLGFLDQLRHGAAMHGALSLSEIYAADEDLRDTARGLERAASFNALGDYIKPESTPELLDVGQIEQSLAIANDMLQASIDVARSLDALKDMARALTEHAVWVKIESEKLVPIYIDNATPLHQICLQRGLPYNYAERLIKVNNIPNPNQVLGAMQVYVG